MREALIMACPPLYLHWQRPVALTLLTFCCMLCLSNNNPTPGLEWFLPAFFLKLLVAHLLRDYLTSERHNDASDVRASHVRTVLSFCRNA